MNFEARAGRRLRLKKSCPALAGGRQVEIHDLGIRGLGMQHPFPLKVGDRTFLEFSWATAPIHLACLVARTVPLKGRPGWFSSGLTVERNSVSRDEYLRRVETALAALAAAEAKLPPVL